MPGPDRPAADPGGPAAPPTGSEATGSEATGSEATAPPARLEVVVMVGLQGCGKSTWVARHLAATHAVVSKDHWPNARHREQRQLRVAGELLAAGRSIVVDNTNPSPPERAPLIALGHACGALVRAVFLDVPLSVCLARNTTRSGRARVPLAGVLATRNRLVPPSAGEGFDRVDVIRPGPAG